MKKINKILSFVLSALSVIVIPLSGCNVGGNINSSDNTVNGVAIKPSGTPYESDFSTLYGICETNVELYPEVDTALTTEWITHVCKSMGIKSYRIWAHIPMLFTVNEDDSITMNQDYADRISSFVSALKEAGVEKISMLVMERLHLAEDKNEAGSAVPDPTIDYEKYIRALAVEEKAYEMMGKEFPNIDYFESINEPDHFAGVGINKNGYVLNFNETGEYNFTTEETARVCMDFNWYQRRGLKKGNPNAKMMLPALCHFSTTAAFLEECYKAIYSRTMPAGQQYCDTDPDNYFDALNWHPYITSGMFGVGTNISEGLWVERQKEIYGVAQKYGDAEKPVWMTEFGFCDNESATTTQKNAAIYGSVTADGQTGLGPTNFVAALETIKKELPFVEAFCMFRMTDMYNVKYDVAGENNFGMFYNPDDPVNKGKPKPVAVAVARYIKGGSLSYNDLADLCKYYVDAFGDVPEEYKCVIK